MNLLCTLQIRYLFIDTHVQSCHVQYQISLVWQSNSSSPGIILRQTHPCPQLYPCLWVSQSTRVTLAVLGLSRDYLPDPCSSHWTAYIHTLVCILIVSVELAVSQLSFWSQKLPMSEQNGNSEIKQKRNWRLHPTAPFPCFAAVYLPLLL